MGRPRSTGLQGLAGGGRSSSRGAGDEPQPGRPPSSTCSSQQQQPQQQQAQGAAWFECPVYLHAHTYDARTSNHAVDVEDCLFSMRLPPGRYAPAHWATRNALMLVTPPSGAGE